MQILMSRASLALIATLYIAGCESGARPAAHVSPAEHNAQLAAPYSPGTGVSGNSFERRPRFYTGPQADDTAQRAATQPSSK